MSVSLLPAIVIREMENQNMHLETQRDRFQSVTTAIDAYRVESGLAGCAFQAHKDYFGEGHLPFITAFRDMMLAQHTANTSHIGHLKELKHGYYHQELIERELDHLYWSIMTAQDMVTMLWPDNSDWQDILDTRKERQSLLREKLEELATYEANTRSLYDDVEAQLPNVRRLLLRLEMQTKCPLTREVSLPTMEEVTAIMAARDMMEDWINEDGTLDYNEVGFLMLKGLDNLTQTELDALTMLFGNPNICHMDLVRAYHTAVLNAPDGEFWNIHDVLTTITDRLTDKFMGQVDDWLWSGTFSDPATRADITAQMQRIQMLAFIVGLENHGGIQDNFPDGLVLDFENNRIEFLGIEGTLSTFRGLFFGTYAYEALEASIQRDFEAAVRKNPYLLTHLLTVLKFIPGVKEAAGVISTAKDIAKALQDAIDMLNQNTTLSAAERDLLERMTALAVARLGGGALSVHMNNGNYILLGTTTMTNKAMINLAGLEAAGFPPSVVLAALANPDLEENEEVIEFLHEGGARDFEYELRQIFEAYFNELSTQFSGLTSSQMPLEKVPLPVLEEIINIWGGN